MSLIISMKKIKPQLLKLDVSSKLLRNKKCNKKMKKKMMIKMMDMRVIFGSSIAILKDLNNI
jgi:hypothetical protein